MHKNSIQVLALLSLLSFGLSSTSDAEAKMQGRVQRADSKRLTRPLESFAQTDDANKLEGSAAAEQTKLNSLVTDHHFNMSGQANDDPCSELSAGEAKSEAIQWPERLAAKASSINLPAQAPKTEAAIDYDAIEKAYSDAVPQHPAPAVAAPTFSCGAQAVGAANWQRAAQNYPRNQTPYVGLDLCICDSPVPTEACVQTRSVGMYGPQSGQGFVPATMHPTSALSNTGAAPMPSAVGAMPGRVIPNPTNSVLPAGVRPMGLGVGL